MSCFVYILRSKKDGSYYVGSTQDINERLLRHNQGRTNHTRARRPWEFLYCEEFPDRFGAMKRENEIKRRKSKDYIESLVRTSRQV